MTKQVKNLKHLQSEIDSALSLISSKGKSPDNIGVPKSGLIAGTQSLLERCENVVNKKKSAKPVLRIIHHLACSGGTIVSKCIASLPNVFLLSELHPTSTLHMGKGKAKFLPADITTQARYARVPDVDELAWKLFIDNIKTTFEHIEALGGTLVIREHSHSDFCVGDSISSGSSLIKHLSPYFDIVSAVTIRNPIDAYLSLVSNDWQHFEPKGFEEYCKRVLAFVSAFSDNQIIRYEDVVKDPSSSIERIAATLKISFADSFIDTFSTVNMTGDSGRSGTTISERPRREVPDTLQQQINNSSSFKQIADMFGYD